MVDAWNLRIEFGHPVCIYYCSLGAFREVFFVNRVHRKPENVGAKSCKA